MKRTLLLCFLAFTTVAITVSCSKNEKAPSNSSKSKITGTWGTKWGSGENMGIYPEFTFLKDGKVNYYTYSVGDYTPHLEEVGTFKFDGDILTMVFPETVTLKYKNKISFSDEKTFVMSEMNEEGYDTWGKGTYFKIKDPILK